MRKRLLVAAGVAVVVLPLLLWFGGRTVLSLSLARYDGEVSLPGVHGPVDILFDARGVPQVWAAGEHDLYFALGYLHASERAFQMELVRRLAAGELAELFGEIAVETDVRQRRLGFARRAAADEVNLDPDSAAMLDAYCAGINAWLEGRRMLPPELVILRHRPRPWRPADVLAVTLFQTWYSVALMDDNRSAAELIERLGDDVRPLLDPAPWSPPSVPELPSALTPHLTGASNSWVVAPQRSSSGAALHASDPHLSVDAAPCFWYLVGLHAPGVDFVGVTSPGMPFALMGHTADIACAFTVAAVDLVDTYRVQLDPERPGHVLTLAGSEPLRSVNEDIRVKGEEAPRRVTFEETNLGVVTGRDGDHLTVLRWAGFDFGPAGIIAAGRRVLRATDFEGFRGAVTRLGALAVNWTFSDRRGNIGYQLGTPIPRRRSAPALGVASGLDPEAMWDGYVDLDDTPHALNPAQGWLATCNNRAVGDSWPYEIPGFWDPYRIVRASEWLSAGTNLSAADMTAMQLDRISARAVRWRGLLADGVERTGDSTRAAEIRAWDGSMAADGHLPALFGAWWYFLGEELLEDELGERWGAGQAVVESVLTDRPSSVVDDVRTPEVETLEDIAARAAGRATAMVGGRTWGEVLRLDIRHPLGSIGPLDAWLGLGRGPLAMGGDCGSLDATWYRVDADAGVFHATIGPSMRFVLDWADPDGFTILTNLGQSGNPLSPHYDDFLDDWYRGRTWTVPSSRAAVEARAASRLRLVPAAG